MRADKKKIPLAFIPNGSGNDLCGCFSLDTAQQGISDLIKGDVIKMDTIKVIIDHEKEEDIPSNDKLGKLRYVLINSSFGLPAQVAHGATPLKKYFGQKSYTLVALRKFLNLKTDRFDVELDGKMTYKDQDTLFLQVNNGKFAGGRIRLNPFGIINDGLVECCIEVCNAGVIKAV